MTTLAFCIRGVIPGITNGPVPTINHAYRAGRGPALIRELKAEIFKHFADYRGRSLYLNPPISGNICICTVICERSAVLNLPAGRWRYIDLGAESANVLDDYAASQIVLMIINEEEMTIDERE